MKKEHSKMLLSVIYLSIVIYNDSLLGYFQNQYVDISNFPRILKTTLPNVKFSFSFLPSTWTKIDHCIVLKYSSLLEKIVHNLFATYDLHILLHNIPVSLHRTIFFDSEDILLRSLGHTFFHRKDILNEHIARLVENLLLLKAYGSPRHKKPNYLEIPLNTLF